MNEKNPQSEACELCESNGAILKHVVSGLPSEMESHIRVCQQCYDQLNGTKEFDNNHWHCLRSSMWSTSPAVQVMAWRLLNELRNEGWAQELLDMLYLEDEVLEWAKSKSFQRDSQSANTLIHKDSNGTALQPGDSVLLIKDLDVKGGGFKAKRGTLVRNIVLVESNSDQLEGKVNGQEIVILTKFVKKA